MQTELERNRVDKEKIDHVQFMIDQGVLKDDGSGTRAPVREEEESEMIRLSQYDDAQSQQAV